MPISYLHVFTYSERPGTEAIEMEGRISPAVRNKRSKMLRILSVKKRHAFYETQLGTTQSVLFEERAKDGYMFGFTPNYVKVKATWNPEWVNQEIVMELNSIHADGTVLGTVKKEELKV